MAKQTINIGASPNDGTGTPLRTSFDYCNQNFTELYTATGPSGNNIVVPGTATITGDLTVDTNVLKVDSANNRVGIGTATPSNLFHVQGSGDIARFTNGSNNAYFAIDSAGYTLFTGAGQTGNGIYAKASTNSVQLWTNGAQRYDIDSTGISTWSVGGSTAMTLNSTGLGVGVTPSAWGSNSKALQVGGGSASVSSTGAGSTASRFAHCAYFDNTNWLYQYTGVGPALYQVTGANAGSTHAWYIAPGGTAGNTITFTQAMTLDASGNLLVGTTTAGGRLDVQTATGDCAARIKSNAAGSNATLAIDYVNSYGTHIIRKSGTDVWLSGVIADTGATPNYKIQNGSAVGVQLVSGATAWTTLSDETVKDIIEPIGNAVAKVGSLRSVIGKFKTDSEGTRRSFLIAQDVKSVLPEAVDVVGENNELGLRYTEVIPLLVAAIKELTARVEALEA